jgi:hypothetical protein
MKVHAGIKGIFTKEVEKVAETAVGLQHVSVIVGYFRKGYGQE